MPIYETFQIDAFVSHRAATQWSKIKNSIRKLLEKTRIFL